mgnify:FL=1|jgi:hypothetical protein
MVFVKVLISLVLLLLITLLYLVVKKVLKKFLRKSKRRTRSVLTAVGMIALSVFLGFASVLLVGSDVPYIKINTDSTDIPANLSDGDLIIGFNGKKLLTTREYKKLLKSHNEYEDYQIMYLHDGSEEYATISKSGEDAYSIGIVCDDNNKLTKVYGIAEKSGLKVGDEITSISGIPVTGDYTAKKILEDYRITSDPVLLGYKRDGKENRINIIPVKEGVKSNQFRVSGAYTHNVPNVVGSAINEVKLDTLSILKLDMGTLLAEPLHVFVFHISIAWLMFVSAVVIVSFIVGSIFMVLFAKQNNKNTKRIIRSTKTIVYLLILPILIVIVHVVGVIQSL